jgi:hypothetical protein
MKSRRFFGWWGCLVAVVITAVAAGRPKTQGEEPAESEKPYTPTRMEWLVVEMSAEFHEHAQDGTWHPAVTFSRSTQDKNAVKVTIYYFPKTPATDVQGVLKQARDHVAFTRVMRRWDWLRLEEKTILVTPPRN